MDEIVSAYSTEDESVIETKNDSPVPVSETKTNDEPKQTKYLDWLENFTFGSKPLPKSQTKIIEKQANPKKRPLSHQEMVADNLVKKYKSSAKRRGKKYELGDELAKDLFFRPCHYCGKKPTIDEPNGIDRIDNEEGYVDHNAITACKTCNYMKWKWGVTDFINKCTEIAQHMSNNSETK